jgi:predicted alpha/beta superfamily hydrolase
MPDLNPSAKEDSDRRPEDRGRAWSERWLTSLPADVALRSWSFSLEPPRLMRADGYGWDHEVRVALPFSYRFTDKLYPVLWIMDNDLESALPVLSGADLVLVGVGAPAVPRREFAVRRAYDFTAAADLYFSGPAGDYVRRETAQSWPELMRPDTGGGAGRFLDFLVHDLRPLLASQYRLDPLEHGLFGFSQGGTLVGYTLFTQPEAFARYICGSPALNSGDYRVFQLEEEYAASHSDLVLSIFFGAGELEMTEHWISGAGIVSSMARMVETLYIRNYPSLQMETRIFPGESHDTVLPQVLRWGVRSVWGDKVARNPLE